MCGGRIDIDIKEEKNNSISTVTSQLTISIATDVLTLDRCVLRDHSGTATQLPRRLGCRQGRLLQVCLYVITPVEYLLSMNHQHHSSTLGYCDSVDHACSAPYSGLEVFLILHFDDFGRQVFDYLDTRSILRLEKVNTRVRSIVHFYKSCMWQSVQLWMRYWSRSSLVRDLLESQKAVLFGAGVVHFLGRRKDPVPPLDICIRRTSVGQLDGLMLLEDYVFQTKDGGGKCIFSSLRHYDREYAVTSLKTGRQRPFRRVAIFEYIRRTIASRLRDTFEFTSRVNVHVVNEDPPEYIMGMALGEFQSYNEKPLCLSCLAGSMNFMTYSHAVSVFPLATFVQNRLLSRKPAFRYSRQEIVWLQREEETLMKYENTDETDVSDIDFQEGGERYIGDNSCWILPLNDSKCE